MFSNPYYQLGCPVWACPQWKGSVYPAKAPRRDWLRHYSSRFNCVEGNSTFYGIPHPDTFSRWAADTHEGFHFCLKLPRSISHERELVGADTELGLFLDGLQRLASANRLGSSFLQLGPQFDPSKARQLQRFLAGLPAEFPWAVEVRHPGWFQPPAETWLRDLLMERQIDRVIFDSRPLFARPATDDSERAARQRKPQVPIRTQTTGRSPWLRLIGNNDPNSIDSAIDEWTELVAIWIAHELRPYVFTHTPDDSHAPELALRFHNRLAQRVPGLKPVPEWSPSLRQQSLF